AAQVAIALVVAHDEHDVRPAIRAPCLGPDPNGDAQGGDDHQAEDSHETTLRSYIARFKHGILSDAGPAPTLAIEGDRPWTPVMIREKRELARETTPFF